MIGQVVPLVFDLKDEIYSNNGITFTQLSHLESLGLLHFNNLSGYQRTEVPQKFAIHYYGRPLFLQIPEGSARSIKLGHALLTNAGTQLIDVCESKPIDGLFEYVIKKYQEMNLIPKLDVSQPPTA